MQRLCRDGCFDIGGAVEVLIQHSRQRWRLNKAIGVTTTTTTKALAVSWSDQRAKDLISWRSVDVCYDVVYELKEQAWLNEFQGDSFRLFSSPHLWNENAMLYLELLKREHRRYYLSVNLEVITHTIVLLNMQKGIVRDQVKGARRFITSMIMS